MSSNTPAASSGGVSPSTANTIVQDVSQNASQVDRLVLEYLRARGHKSAEASLLEAIEGGSTEVAENTLSSDDLIKGLAVFAQRPSRPGENVLKDSSSVLQELSTMGNPSSIQTLIASLGTAGAEEILSLDPTDKHEGFRELESWVEGSLDMYKPEFLPMLFPIFCHFYLDLVQKGFKEAALHFHATFSPSLALTHNATLHHLSTLMLPSHVQNDDQAQRFRNEKYVIRMSRSGFSLLIGWLTEGVGGETPGAGEGFSGEKGKRGRAAVMRVVNNHLRFDVTSASATSMSPNAWEESTGLLSSLIPATAQPNGSSAVPNPHTFNSSKGELKLGPAPISEELRAEMERVLREQAMLDRDPISAQYDVHFTRPQPLPGVVSPTEADLLPHPPSFKTIDVQREVEKVRDARKRIRLDPSAMTSVDSNSTQGTSARPKALPSVCAYTLHDVGEGEPCCTFSPDISLMAAGFSESYIRLWSLKGEKLRGLRNDASPDVADSSGISRLLEPDGSSTRKLVGHSGPVYSLSFDPLGGSAAPPKYLLSASADATTRLWSLDTMTNVVAYRGHQNPVWDVQWSPMGTYFATASRDRTARLWSTDRTSALRIYVGHLSDVDCVRFHPNSLYLATGSSDRTARLWDVQRGTCVRVFIGHQGTLSALAISPDGRYLASAGEDLAINIWDIGSGRRIKKMTGHVASVYSLAFSAESSLLVSGGADWTVRCWDVRSTGSQAKSHENGVNESQTLRPAEESNETTDLLATFPTKRTPVINVHFTPRNLCLAAGYYLPLEPR